jgi:peptidoglycan/xylan/chitin deacetylase (PgdA/CDA1 family)
VLAARGIDALTGLDDDGARHAISAAIERLKKLTLAELTSWIDELRRGLARIGIEPTGYGDDRFMSWNEVASLANSDVVTIGSHACSHRPLDKLDPDTRRRELAESRRIIEARLGKDVRAIAYPNGNHDDAVVEDTRAAGYDLAFTTEQGTVAAGDARLRLRRMNIAEIGTGTPAEFLCHRR